MKKILIIILLFTTVLIGGCEQTKNQRYKKQLSKIKVGMDVEQVIEIMGEPMDIATTKNNNYVCYYWFVGADSIEDAEKKYKKDIAVTYYGVLLYTENFSDFYVRSEEDIISGTWRKD